MAEATEKVEARVRAACREKFRTAKLLDRILPDIDSLLEIGPQAVAESGDYDEDPALPAPLWSDEEEEAT